MSTQADRNLVASKTTESELKYISKLYRIKLKSELIPLMERIGYERSRKEVYAELERQGYKQHRLYYLYEKSDGWIVCARSSKQAFKIMGHFIGKKIEGSVLISNPFGKGDALEDIVTGKIIEVVTAPKFHG